MSTSRAARRNEDRRKKKMNNRNRALSISVLTGLGLSMTPGMASAAVIATPTGPVVSDSCGTANDFATLTETAGSDWFQLNADGSATPVAGSVAATDTQVTFEARPEVEGDTYADGTTFQQYTVTYSNAPCLVVAAAQPTFNDVSGTAEDTFTIPASEGVDYFVNGQLTVAGTYAGAGTVTIEAVAQEGYELDPNSPSVFSNTFSAEVDAVVVVAAPPVFTDESGTENDTFTIPATEGVTYLVGGVAVAPGTYAGSGTVVVDAVAQEGYELDPNSPSSFANTFSAEVDVVVVVPAEPTFADLSGTADDTFTIPESEGVAYTVDGVVVAPGVYPAEGTVIIEAVALEGYELDPNAPSSFTNAFSAEVIITAPTAPVFTDESGTADDVVVIPEVEGVNYLIDGVIVPAGEYPVEGAVNVTLEAQEGYAFAEGTVTAYDFDFNANLIIGAIAEPIFTDESGIENDIVTIPATEGVDYLLNGEIVPAGEYAVEGEAVVTLAAQEGYEFAPDAVLDFLFDFNANVIVTDPAAPEFVDESGILNDVVIIPETVGVDYLIDGVIVPAGEYAAEGAVTVTLAAQEGYELDPEATAEFAFEFNAAEDIVVIDPAAPGFIDESGVENDIVTIPATEGVDYLLNGEVVEAGDYPAEGTVTVVLEAQDGYVFAEGTVTEYTNDFSAEVDLIVVSPAAPVFIDEPGILNDTVTIPEVEGVEYLLNGEVTPAGTYEVTGDVTVEAVALEGYELDPEATAIFNFSFTDAEEGTVVTPTAPEFVDESGTANDVVIIPEQEGVIYAINGEVVAAGEYPGSGVVRVTITAAEGFTLAEGSPTEYVNSFSAEVDATVVTPPMPVYDAENGTVTIPDVEGVIYAINGEVVEPGVYDVVLGDVITATPAEGFAFPDGETAVSWEVVEDPDNDNNPIIVPDPDQTPTPTPVIDTPGVTNPVAPIQPVVADDVAFLSTDTGTGGTGAGNLADTGSSTALGALALGGLLTAAGAGFVGTNRRRLARTSE